MAVRKQSSPASPAGEQSAVDQPAGGPRQRAARGPARLLTLLCWWALLMAFWLMLDDSFRPDELVAGALAAALAALLATAVTGMALGGRAAGAKTADRHGGETGWLRQAAALPGRVLRDTAAVYVALGRMVVQGGPPPGGYTEIPVRYGGDTSHDVVRRVLLTWARSLAPNTFAVGMDPGRDVMIVHRLAGDPQEEGDEP